jgi:hypothetical protein
MASYLNLFRGIGGMSVFRSSAAAANKRNEIECGLYALNRESIRVLYDLS